MSSPNSSAASKAQAPKRPGHGPRHGSSWLTRLHRHHDRKHHTQEQEPLLANDEPESDDVEAQEEQPQQPQPNRLQNLQSRVREHLTTSKEWITRNSKTLFIACVLTLLTLFLSLLVGFWFKHHQGSDKKLNNICTSAACVHAASDILDNMDPEASSAILYSLDSGDFTEQLVANLACADFNQLTCGGFDQHHDLRPDQSNMFTGTLMVENSQTILRHILESDQESDEANFKKLKADYNACMDEKTIKHLGLEPLQAVIDEIKTLFPASDASSKAWKASPVLSAQHSVLYKISNRELTDALLYMMKLEVDAMVSLGVGADDKEPETQVIFVSPARLGLPSKEYYEDKEMLAKYQVMAAQVMDNFYKKTPSNDSSNLWGSQKQIELINSVSLMKGVVAFETRVAALTPPEEDLNDVTKTYNPMTPANVSETLPDIDFEHIIAELAPKGYSADTVIAASPKYLKDLSKVLKSTPRQTVQAFLVWKVILSYASRVEDPALKPLNEFNNELRGKDPDAVEERWRTCIRSADNDLGWILSKYFVDNAFSPSAKKFGDSIVTDIKESFVNILGDADWMTDEVRERSIKKVHAIDQKIGYPTSNPDIMDSDALEKYYHSVTISNETYFANAIEVAQFEVKQEWAKLGQPTRHDEWGMTVPTVNAYYNPAGNEIVFPAGIMQHPVFYDPRVPQYLSYGAFGAVAGHELSHAFDNTGSQYDETGRYADWWDNDTRVAFEDKTKCYVDQYAKFSVPGPKGPLHVNGKLTLGENVADAGGIHAAFSAWKEKEAVKPSQALPGLEKFTNDQLFFINYANWWCGKSTKEAAVEAIYLDPHAPKWARIIGTMANSADFKKAFNCPSKKATCELW